MAKSKKVAEQIDFPFYSFLHVFIKSENKKVYNSFTQLSKKFLDFNNPEKGKCFLRQPQFDALEVYVFLKEFCNNEHLHQIFEDWFYKTNQFEGRKSAGVDERKRQVTLFGPIEANNEEDITRFKDIFEQIKSFEQVYPNYIFALTMGIGKTVLMATSIFYEFLLANKYPKNPNFCHNALVFAPDKTVLQSLKEIETFDMSNVIPPEYVSWLDANLKFYFLDESGDALNTIENSKYNIIISNTQKIILKKQRKDPSASQLLYSDTKSYYKSKALSSDYEDLYDMEIDSETDLVTNQRFAKLIRLQQLGIYVDEAHHVFGNNLAADFGLRKTSTSLRVTINELAAQLEDAGTSVVACYNYTGTPYVGKRLLPEVVYAYGLKDAIDNKYLKQVDIKAFENIRKQTIAFVRLAITEFWSAYSGNRYENMLPKIAFFASSIEELQNELKPAVEDVLLELGISTSKILVNTGDPKITTNDDLREFKNLDTPTSEKQFILLVNKGKEGWNCRSLFGVALHREPKSKIFVLQATMRCLRSIGSSQETGKVFLSDENIKILDAELQENFKLSVDDLNHSGDKSETIEVRLVPPPVTIKLKRIKKLHELKEKKLNKTLDFQFDKIDLGQYKITGSKRSILDVSKKISAEEDYTQFKDKREFSELTLIAEISRYLNLSPLKIKSIISDSEQGLPEAVKIVNEFNEVLFDWIIPKMFNYIYELLEYERQEEDEITLVKEPEEGFYRVKAKPNLRASLHDPKYSSFLEKTFHLDNYCFDSNPENHLFWTLLHDEKIDRIWFTGMLTHGQSDFAINYIDPVSHTLRAYYPDFLVQMNDNSYVIVEVKGDNKIDDEVVRAKEIYARQLADVNSMRYLMIKGSDAMNGIGIS